MNKNTDLEKPQPHSRIRSTSNSNREKRQITYKEILGYKQNSQKQ